MAKKLTRLVLALVLPSLSWLGSGFCSTTCCKLLLSKTSTESFHKLNTKTFSELRTSLFSKNRGGNLQLDSAVRQTSHQVRTTQLLSISQNGQPSTSLQAVLTTDWCFQFKCNFVPTRTGSNFTSSTQCKKLQSLLIKMHFSSGVQTHLISQSTTRLTTRKTKL